MPILCFYLVNHTIYGAKLQADVDNSGTIDYKEFIAATLHLTKADKEDHLAAAFSYFDRDGSGFITQDELQRACEDFGIEDFHLEEMIQEADQDNVSVFLCFFCLAICLRSMPSRPRKSTLNCCFVSD